MFSALLTRFFHKLSNRAKKTTISIRETYFTCRPSF